MRYLFFDIECANCFDGAGKICEFGYCITDENFKIEKQKNILINPKSPFDPYVVKKILHSPKEEYLSSPDFKSFYPHINSILSEKDQIVVGHTVEADAKYIFDECIRYGEKPPQFNFLDIRDVYKDMIKSSSSVSLGKMGEQLEVEFSGLLHSAITDAMLTMCVTKAICNKLSLSLSDVVEKYPFAVGGIDLIERGYEEKRLMALYLKTCAEKGCQFITGENAEIFNRYRKTAKPKKGKKDIFNGKNICISKNYEYVHYLEMLEISQLVINGGGVISGSPTKCDIFVKYDVEIENKKLLPCKRYETVKRTIRSGKTIEIMEFEEFLQLLSTDKNSLSQAKNVNYKLIERLKLGMQKKESKVFDIKDVIRNKKDK